VSDAAAERAARCRAHVRGLYGMVDLPGPEADVAAATALCAALLEGGVGVVQVRMKSAGARAMLAVCAAVLPLCRAGAALLVVNDRLDVALAAGADGCHLGQDDLPLAAARALAPPQLLLGVSTHDLAQARAALAGGADYLGFGPIFSTRTKHRPDPVVGLEQLAALCREATAPVVAIGGIDLTTVAAVAATAAPAAALIAAVNGSPDVFAAARAAGRAFTTAVPRR